METQNKLQEYKFDHYTIVTNFKKFQDAEEFAKENRGELIEVGFLDGADNPIENNSAHLIADKKPFRVELPYSHYDIYYSYEEAFQNLAKTLQYQKKEQNDDMYLEDILSDQNLADGNKILIVDGDAIKTITTKERIKFLMGGHLYEIGVKISHPDSHKN